MIKTLAVSNYRSLRDLVVPLAKLNLITGPNGSGKSNLYKSLRLLTDTATGGIVSALAREGGLSSVLWAGPERGSHGGSRPQGTVRKSRVRMKLGFASDDFGYAIELGLPTPSNSAFMLDPEVKSEVIWAGPKMRPAATLVERNGPSVRIRRDEGWTHVDLPRDHDSIFTQMADFNQTPELFFLREKIKDWRFYDNFRTDVSSLSRIPQIGTRTPALHHDGHDIAAAVQTIVEVGDERALKESVDAAFPRSHIFVERQDDGRFTLYLKQPGMLRPMSAAELSDGSLRYLHWVAALLTPKPPSTMVLNEPETSLHKSLLPALARLIALASQKTQVWVISHAHDLVESLRNQNDCHLVELDKNHGETLVSDQELLDRPSWRWSTS